MLFYTKWNCWQGKTDTEYFDLILISWNSNYGQKDEKPTQWPLGNKKNHSVMQSIQLYCWSWAELSTFIVPVIHLLQG